MKITIAYTSGEERDAGILQHFIQGGFPDAKIRRCDRHPLFRYSYITTKLPAKPCGEKAAAERLLSQQMTAKEA